jgi:D-aspartate ligase
MNHSEVPVVVVGGGLNGLGVVRSLAAARVPVFLLETTRRLPAAWSRHCTFVRARALEGRGLLDALTRLAATLSSRPVLLLTTDRAVAAVAAMREQLDPVYRILLPPADTLALLSDKASFHRLAERAGLTVPRGIPIEGKINLARIEELTPPLILKPADKRPVEAGLLERAVRASSIAEARIIASRMLQVTSSVMVQEWIEGEDSDIYFTLFNCDAQANIVGLFTGRKLVCTPPAIGNTAICVAAPEAAQQLLEPTRQLVARTSYVGLGGLEFKRDARTGQFVIIEPTAGRTDLQEEIATLCGVNLPALAYWAALDTTPPMTQASVPASVAWRSSIEFRTPRELTARRLPVFDGFFRWYDPFPAFYYYVYERLAKGVCRRVLRVACISRVPRAKAY